MTMPSRRLRGGCASQARSLKSFLVLFILLALASATGSDALSPYPSPEAAYDEVRELARLHPDRAEVFVVGESAGGHELLCLRIHEGDGKERPAALIGGAIHGDEYIGNRTAMAAARLLLADGETSQAVLDKMDVYFLPLINPDGYFATWDSAGEAGQAQTRLNANGVDLNRNFGKPLNNLPLPMGFSGTADPGSTTYTGPSPWSEPEARAVRDLARDKRFFAAVDFHSHAGMIIPLLCDDRVAEKGLWRMARAYRAAQDDKYSIFMVPYQLPFYQGSMEECLYREAGTLAILIELGKKGDLDRRKDDVGHFWAYNPRDRAVMERVARDNGQAALAALLAAFDYTGGVTEPRPMELR